MVGSTDGNYIRLLFGEQFSVVAIAIQLAVEILVKLGGVPVIDITDGDHLSEARRAASDSSPLVIAAATSAHADRGQSRFAIRVLSSRRVARPDIGDRSQCAGGRSMFEELTSLGVHSKETSYEHLAT